MATKPPFVDAHVHLWRLDGAIRYPWLTPPFADDGPNGSVEAIARDYLPDDYLADAGDWDVRGIVHIDAGADPRDALAETDWLQAMHDARGLPSAIVAFAALDDPDVERLLAAHVARGNVRGIRHIVNWHPDPRRSYTPRDVTGDDAWARGFALLAKYGLSFDLQCYPGQMPAVAALAARHPEVPVAINHMGMPVLTDTDGLDAWRRGMDALAALPHVAVKISGLGFVRRAWTLDEMSPLVRETIARFGVARAMIASDFPTDKLFGSFDRHLAAYDAITADRSAEDRARLFGGNANLFYRLGLDLTAPAP